MKKFIILKTSTSLLASEVDNFGTKEVEKACAAILSIPSEYLQLRSGTHNSAKIKYTDYPLHKEFEDLVKEKEFDVIFTTQMP